LQSVYQYVNYHNREQIYGVKLTYIAPKIDVHVCNTWWCVYLASNSMTQGIGELTNYLSLNNQC